MYWDSLCLHRNVQWQLDPGSSVCGSEAMTPRVLQGGLTYDPRKPVHRKRHSLVSVLFPLLLASTVSASLTTKGRFDVIFFGSPLQLANGLTAKYTGFFQLAVSTV